MKIIRNPSAGGDPEKYRSLEPEVIFAPDLFVDGVDGLDTNNGLTALTPFKTLNKARTVANASGVGNLIYVFKGVYNENIIMSTLGFTDSFNMTWYLETGVFLNVTSRITTDSLTHFFDWVLLAIRGKGIIRGIGNDLIDTTDSFFSTISVQSFNFTYTATSINPKPVKLGSQSDDSLDIVLQDVGIGNGQFGFGSSVNLDNDDYFIWCEDTSFSRIEDNIIIRGGEFATRQAGAIFASTDVPKVTLTWYTKGLQNLTNEANGIHIESDIFVLKADSEGAQLRNLNVRALGTGANVLSIADMNDPSNPFSSEIQIEGGTCTINRCEWNGTGRYIWCDQSGRLIIKDTKIKGTVDQLLSAYNAASELFLEDVKIQTSVGDAIYLFTALVDIVKCQIVANAVCVNGPDIPAKAINFFNTLGNSALPLGITDPQSGYTANAAFDEIN